MVLLIRKYTWTLLHHVLFSSDSNTFYFEFRNSTLNHSYVYLVAHIAVCIILNVWGPQTASTPYQPCMQCTNMIIIFREFYIAQYSTGSGIGHLPVNIDFKCLPYNSCPRCVENSCKRFLCTEIQQWKQHSMTEQLHGGLTMYSSFRSKL